MSGSAGMPKQPDASPSAESDSDDNILVPGVTMASPSGPSRASLVAQQIMAEQKWN